MTIYVVVQGDGEYSSRYEQPIRAYRTEAGAASFVTACEAHNAIALPQTGREAWKDKSLKPWSADEWRAWRRAHPNPSVKEHADEPYGGSSRYDHEDYAVYAVPLFDTFTLGE